MMSLSLHLRLPIVIFQLDGNKDTLMTYEAADELSVVLII